MMNMGASTQLLNNGSSTIPLLGLGTAGSSTHPLIKSSITTAIQAGYRHIDTASAYGSEAAIGEALAEAFQSGLVRREEMFITSKVWCSEVDDVVAAIKRSLSSLGLEYLDLYLIHWPLRFTIRVLKRPKPEEIQPLDIHSTWRAMEECVELGLTKAIGVSNFSSKKIRDLLKTAKIVPAVNQVQMNPRRHQTHLRRTCSEANIHVSAWAPLGAPKQNWGSHDLLEDPVIEEISIKHGKTPAQVLLRWALEKGVSVIAKSYNKERIIENSQIFDWKLTEEDHERIATIKQYPTLPAPYLEDGNMYGDLGFWDGGD